MTLRPPVYRGLPRPIKVVGGLGLGIATGIAIGLTAPTALMRLGATAALRPGLLDWYAVRALGFIGYLVLAASIVYGLLLSTKILDAIAHRPVSFALHKDLSLVGLFLLALHGLFLLGDESYPFTLRSILVPFASPYAPLETGIGQLAFYATAIVVASFYVRRHIGQSAWRLIHYITFLAFIGGTVHGLTSGSDSNTPWALVLYLVPTAMTIFLTTYRIVLSVSARTRATTPQPAGPLPLARKPLDRPGAGAGPWQ